MENLFKDGCFKNDVNCKRFNIDFRMGMYSTEISGVKPREGERFIWLRYRDVSEGIINEDRGGGVHFTDPILCEPNTIYNVSWMEMLEGNCDNIYSNCKIICNNGVEIPLFYIPIVEFGKLNKISMTFKTPVGCSSFTLQLGVRIIWNIHFFHTTYYDIQIRKVQVRSTQYRGAMLNGLFANANQTLDQSYNKLVNDIATLKSWGANLVRFQLWGLPEEGGTTLDVVKRKIPYIKKILDFCQNKNMKVAIALMEVPGGVSDYGRHLLFENRTYFNVFLAIWDEIAKAVKNHPAIYAYDLINEPAYYPYMADPTLIEAQKEAARRIRHYDGNTPISIECKGAGPQEFHLIKDINDIGKVIYQIHMYFPHEFTHQGLSEHKKNVEYPGFAGEVYADKERLHDVFKAVIQFQEKNPLAKIYVGEFSAICWAKGGEKYLEDCISIFEKYGWDWTYHSFREWDGWSVEHQATVPYQISEAQQDTERKKVLLKYYALNR